MPAALTPDLALSYLRALSADITGAVVLDAAGERLAGPPALHAPARELMAAAPPGPAELQGRSAHGAVFAARDHAHQLVAITGPLALPGLTRHDLRTALAALRGGASRSCDKGRRPEPPRETPPAAPIEVPADTLARLLSAASGRL